MSIRDTSLLSEIDLEVALSEFKGECQEILIQVPFVRHIPILKRMVISKLGEPSFNHASKLKYYNKTINITSVFDRNPDGSEILDTTFYVGYDDDSLNEAECRLRGYAVI